MKNRSGKNEIFFATRPIAPPWDEGSKNMVFEISKGLNSLQATLLTYKNQESFHEQSNVSLKQVYPYSTSRIISLRQKLTFLRTLISGRASIFHFYFTPEILTSMILRILKKFKRGIFLQTIPTPLKDIDAVEKYIFGDFVVVQSQTTLNFLKNSGIERASLIYPGVDLEKFHPDVSSGNLRRKLKIQPGQRVVLYAGSYYLNCNDDLTKVIRELTKKYSDTTFIFACRLAYQSDYQSKNKIKVFLAREKISNRVVFLDTVQNMPELISLADIVIFPPRVMLGKSDIPMVLLEALSMEKPIVITDIAPLNEIMMEDVGERVPRGNPEALAAALIKLLNDPESRKIKGRRGREMVLKHFNINDSVKEYLSLYENLLRVKK